MILKKRNYRHQSGTRVHFIELTDIAISASEIRALVRKGKSIRYLLPSAVKNYIKRRRLYTATAGRVSESQSTESLGQSAVADAGGAG